MDFAIPSYKSKALLEVSTLPFKTDTNANDSENTKDSFQEQMWKMYNKQKDSLQNGARMENLSWRMVRDLAIGNCLDHC